MAEKSSNGADKYSEYITLFNEFFSVNNDYEKALKNFNEKRKTLITRAAQVHIDPLITRHQVIRSISGLLGVFMLPLLSCCTCFALFDSSLDISYAVSVFIAWVFVFFTIGSFIWSTSKLSRLRSVKNSAEESSSIIIS